jgi:hypothetical protein
MERDIKRLTGGLHLDLYEAGVMCLLLSGLGSCLFSCRIIITPRYATKAKRDGDGDPIEDMLPAY